MGEKGVGEARKESGRPVAALALLAVLLTIGCAVAVGFAVYNHNQNVDNGKELDRMREMVEHLEEQEETQALNLKYTWDDQVEKMSADEYSEFRKKVMKELTNQDRNVEIEALSIKSQYARWMGFGKEIYLRHQPGPCRKIMGAVGGSEDLTILPNGLMFITSGWYAKYEGSVLLYDFNKPNQDVKKLNIVKGPGSFFELDDFHPHGMSSWIENGETFIYVISHPPFGDSIEMFQFDEATETLTHLRNFTSPDFNYMNDLVMMSKTSFYITKFWRWRDSARIRLEIRLLSNFGEIMYYDGSQPPETAATMLIKGLTMPNGINISPDKKYLYVAEFGSTTLRIYKRDTNDNSLIEYETRYTDTGIDNIEIDPHTGDLWIGCHPIIHRIWEYDARGATGITPSQVIRVKVTDGHIQDIVETYINDGSEIPGSTSASYYNGTMVIGALAAEHIVVCDALSID